MTVKHPLTFDYNVYCSFIHLLEVQAKKYGENTIVRYQPPNEEKFMTLSYAQAHRIASNLASEWASFLHGIDTVALLADSSIDYIITILTIFKLNVTLTLLSPGNTAAANVSVLNSTGSKYLLASAKYSDMAKTCAAQASCEVKVLEPFDFVRLNVTPAAYDSHTPTASEIEKTVLIIHSSGTTSTPKAIRLSNRYMIVLVDLMKFEARNVFYNTSDVFLPLLPLYHVLGLSYYLTSMVFGGSSLMFSHLPPSPRNISAAIESYNVSTIVSSPSTLSQIAHYIETTGHNTLCKLKVCVSGGAPLSNSVGSYLYSKGVNLVTGFGSTETMGLMYSCIPNDLNLREIHTAIKPYCLWEPVDEKTNLYQLVIKGNCPTLATGVSNRENGDFATNDLFTQDPNNPHLWRYYARNDDILTMENGKKTNPAQMETILLEAKVIRRCVIIGEGRQCTAALIEPELDVVTKFDTEEINVQVHEAVERANQAAPAHSKIMPSMVYILPLYQQLPATSKGSVIRRKAIKQYEEAIDKMYHEFLEGPKMTRDDSSTLRLDEFLAQAACQVLGQTNIEPTATLFDYGLNSLLAIQLRNIIATRFENLPANFVFEYPTLTMMAEGIAASKPSESEQQEARYRETQAILDSYLERAKAEFPTATTSTGVVHDQHTIMLTGATGSLGAFLLRNMILSPRVKKIYCLVRGQNLMDRLKTSFKSRLLDASLLEHKVQVLPMNLNDPYLGWDESVYTKLKNEVTIIQHCAWLLDFNQPIDHYERECLRGMYNLLKFAYKETDPIHVHFVSSISAAACSKDDVVLEKATQKDPHVAMPMGYAQSKYIVEHLLDYLTREKNFPCIVERMGQLCSDTEHGTWNTSEHYPLMIIGGAQLGLMPDLQELSADWLPVDIAAAGILNIMLKENHDQGFYHIVNPHRITWSEVLKATEACGINFQVVKPEEWVQALGKYQDNPAYCLLSYFERRFRPTKKLAKMPIWQMEHAIAAAPCLTEALPFNTSLLQKSLGFWSSIGFYNPNN